MRCKASGQRDRILQVIRCTFKRCQHGLSKLREAGVYFNLKMCCFFTDRVEYLGHVIKPGALTIDEARVKSFKQQENLRNVTELRDFLRLCNLYRRFIFCYLDIAASLTNFLRKGQLKNFPTLEDNQSQAFDRLIRTMFIKTGARSSTSWSIVYNW